ncbi:MAG: sensor histidine kinase [Lachnospirales bacterium]
MSSERYISRYQEKDEAAISSMETMISNKAREGNFRVLIFDYNGFCISDTNNVSNGKYYNFPELNLALRGEDNANVYKDTQTIYSVASIVNDNFEVRGAVLVVDGVTDIYDFFESLNDEVWFIMCVLVILSLIVATAISSWFVNPINKMLRVIEEMGDGHLNKRMLITNNDEFSELGAAFNNMAEKIGEVELRKDQFVSNVSHELKTPLSAIKVLGESTLHMDGLDKETYDEFLGDIISEVDRMTEIINDLLTLVKLDNEGDRLNIQSINIEDFMNNIVKSLYSLANYKDISLDVSFSANVDFEVDKLKMFSAISNIVENAIKYTGNGGSVKINTIADHQFVYISVKDTGVGIEEHELDNIFTRFYRVDDSRNRETGGTGLGLSIAHSVILLHNGSIRVNSVVGEGSLFLVRLPLRFRGRVEVNDEV